MSEHRVSPKLRQQVAERAKYCCEYCQSQARYSPDPFAIEHIQPIAKGGRSELENLAFACQGCNGRKYIHTQALDPVSQAIVSLYHPRQDCWTEHFQWSDDYTQVKGLTPVGRATVEKLQLNRVGLVNLRHLLYKTNEHPP